MMPRKGATISSQPAAAEVPGGGQRVALVSFRAVDRAAGTHNGQEHKIACATCGARCGDRWKSCI